MNRKYKGSPYLLLSSVFPEYEWLPWKFAQCPKNYWNDDVNKKKFLDWAGKQLGVNEISDWNKITTKVFKNIKSANYRTYLIWEDMVC